MLLLLSAVDIHRAVIRNRYRSTTNYLATHTTQVLLRLLGILKVYNRTDIVWIEYFWGGFFRINKMEISSKGKLKEAYLFLTAVAFSRSCTEGPLQTYIWNAAQWSLVLFVISPLVWGIGLCWRTAGAEKDGSFSGTSFVHMRQNCPSLPSVVPRWQTSVT